MAELGKAEFKVEDVSGVKLNPTDYTFTLSSMTKINYFMTCPISRASETMAKCSISKSEMVKK